MQESREPTVIFLDIDGVLTTLTTKWQSFHPDCVKALKHILENTNALMVLSSSWRRGFIDWKKKKDRMVDKKDALRRLSEWLDADGLQGHRLIDSTPCLFNETRGKEIETWLENHPEIKRFIILDDDDDIEPFIDNLIQTHPVHGLSMEDAEEAVETLNEIP